MLTQKQRKQLELVVVNFSSISTFLAGFSFAALTLLLTSKDQIALALPVFIVTALTTIVFTASAVIGSFFQISTEFVTDAGHPTYHRWVLLMPIGLIGFFVDIALLSFTVGNTVGWIFVAICTVSVFFILNSFGTVIIAIERANKREQDDA